MNSSKTRLFVIFGFFMVVILGLSWVSNIPMKNHPVALQVNMPAEEKSKLLTMAISKNISNTVTVPAKFAKPDSPVRNQSITTPAPQQQSQSIATGQEILNRINKIHNTSKSNPTDSRLGLARGRGRKVANPEQQKAIDELLDKLGGNATLQMDNVSRTLRYLDGDLSKIVSDSKAYQSAHSQSNYSAMSIALVDELRLIMNLSEPQKEFVTNRIKEDNLGMTHVFLQQQYDGIPVYGAQVGVHYDKNNNPIQVSGVYAPMPGMISAVKSCINPQTALQNARQDIGSIGNDYASPKIEQMIYWDIDRVPVQTYFIALTPTVFDHWHYFISAETGEIVHKSRPICAAAAVGQSPDLSGQIRDVHCWEDGGAFGAIDTTKPMYQASSQPPDIKATKGAIIVLDAENQILEEAQSFTIVNSNNKNNWDPTAVSVLHNYSLVEDYYRRTFNRNSIDDKGMNILAIIHAQFKGPDGSVYKDNAFWNPGAQLMVFGDGEVDFQNLPSSLDVTGHELTHGVIDHEAKLIYENQSGALNEHLADFFGAMVDRDEWLLGDGVTKGKEALRDMKNPHNPNILAAQPQTMTEYRNLPNTPQGDNGGVHVNSGIPNHMAYLLAEGPDGIGRDKTEKILYRALSEYMTQRSTFIDYRRAAISSTRDLHGENSAEEASVKKAFDAVEIFDQDGGDSPNQPTPGQATVGNDVALFLLGDLSAGVDQVHDDLFYQLAINVNGENLLAAPRYVVNTRPAVSGDGQWFLYVDTTNNLYWTDGASEEKWTDSGIIRSIAMSKDQRYIVFTSTSYDNFITVIDTETGEINIADLYVTRMDGVTQDLDFADVMTFNFRGDSLIYDAVMQMKLDNGEEYPVWGIYCLRMVDLNTQQLVAQTPGEQIGNPTIANTNDHLLLADYVVSEGDDEALAMVAIDFLDMKMSVLFGPMNDFAHPTFRGDDQKIIFRGSTGDNSQFALIEGELQDNQQALIDTSTRVLFEAFAPITYPVGFRIGEYVKQEGKISVPKSIAIGETPVLTQNSQTISIANIGNSDLSLIEISIEEDIDGAFSHTGINQQISAGKNISFDIVFNPKKTGAASAALKIKSTDASQPESIISISGNGTAANTPTPTATIPGGVSTPTPAAPTPTPISGLEPTPLPGSEDQLSVYEFDKDSLSDNGWLEIPGGFGGADPGILDFITFNTGLFSASADDKGLSLTVEPGQVAFLMANTPVNTQDNPILLRMTVRSNTANASIFLVALKGELSNNTLDGSLTYNNRVNASSFLDKDQRLTLIYEPDQGGKITPAIQVAGVGDETTTVYVDKLEIFMLKPDGSYSGILFRSSP